jgi:peptidoglycan/xylan/chitin deacetylase (PgdA/CDA1 family)
LGALSARAAGRHLFGARLNILMYHAVTDAPLAVPDWCFLSAERFAAQMRWLAEQPLDVRPLREAVADLGTGGLRRPTVALTFDDGFRNNVDVALPILERYRLPATIFLTTGVVDSARTLWPNRVVLAVTRSEKARLCWRGRDYPLAGREQKATTSAALQERIKASDGHDPDAAVADLEAALGVPVAPDVARTSPFAMMDRRDIATARASGLVTFGAHSVHHPILARLDDRRLAAEIEGSVRDVEALTGARADGFAYPNGGQADWDERAVRCLRACGVTFAVSTIERPNWASADPLRLARWNIGADMSTKRFRAVVRNLHPAALRALLERRRASGVTG